MQPSQNSSFEPSDSPAFFDPFEIVGFSIAGTPFGALTDYLASLQQIVSSMANRSGEVALDQSLFRFGATLPSEQYNTRQQALSTDSREQSDFIFGALTGTQVSLQSLAFSPLASVAEQASLAESLFGRRADLSVEQIGKILQALSPESREPGERASANSGMLEPQRKTSERDQKTDSSHDPDKKESQSVDDRKGSVLSDDVTDGLANGLAASYYSLNGKVRSLSMINFERAPDATNTVTSLDVYMSRSPFWDGGPSDRFAARYDGYLNVEKSGVYEIIVTSDDGSAVVIDGELVVNNDGVHKTSEKSVTLELAPGSHEIQIFYFDNRGSQTLRLEWAGPDSNGVRSVIDGSSFSLEALPPTGDGTGSGSHGDDTTTDGGDDSHDGGTGDHSSGDGTDSGDTTSDGGDNSHDHGTGDHTSGDGTDSGDTTTDGGDNSHDHGTGDDTSGDEPDSPYTQPTTPEEEEAFVTAVKSAPEHGGHMAHADDAAKAIEHGQALALVPRAEATHIAVRDGDWFDPDTWYQGRIPDDGAKVLIPQGVTVRYDGESDASLFTVRIDGKLSFATDVDTKMVVDTMVNSPSGHLVIGTEDNPIQDGVNAQIVIANNGDIDVNWDPTLLSRGVISHGKAEIHGAEKTPYTKVADAPMAGDTEIHLAEIPDNWSVGDTIVLTGTHKTGWTWNRKESRREHIESEDEEVVITAINGNTITIDRPLQHDHDTPRSDLSAYVANMSRNVTFSSEDGDTSAIHHRGHVMFMHNKDVDVRYAAFEDLGRTDKSQPAFHVETLESVSADSNIQARYSLHFHKTGTEDQDNPAIAYGNTVSGSPGWGFVHHSSHAEFVQNIAFDVFGAAFVAEDGDETGLWWENMAIKSEGIGYGHSKTKSGEDVARDDVGRTGDGFFFGGRAVEAGHNIAANTTHGFVWMLRAADARPDVDQLDHPDAYYGREFPRSNDQVPIQGFHDNEAFGTHVGLIVVKGSKWQGHDVRSVLDGFTNWETSNGVQLTYTSHYTLKDFDIVGTRNSEPIATADTGFEFGNATFDLVVNGLKVEGFKTGVDFEQRAGNEWTDSDYGHVVIDLETSNNVTDIAGFDSNRHQLLTKDQLVEGRLEFVMEGDTSIALNEGILLDGTKIDSIGARSRQFTDDIQELDFGKHILPLLLRDGYYETANGDHVMLINDYVADRATGELLKFAHVITLEATDEALAKLGAVNNGLIDLSSEAPETKDDFVNTVKETAIVIDALANDFDPEGDLLEIDGFTNPLHGDLSLQDDGTLLYEPHSNKVGVDTFDYWAADDNGMLSKSTVYVDITDF